MLGKPLTCSFFGFDSKVDINMNECDVSKLSIWFVSFDDMKIMVFVVKKSGMY